MKIYLKLYGTYRAANVPSNYPRFVVDKSWVYFNFERKEGDPGAFNIKKAEIPETTVFYPAQETYNGHAVWESDGKLYIEKEWRTK